MSSFHCPKCGTDYKIVEKDGQTPPRRPSIGNAGSTGLERIFEFMRARQGQRLTVAELYSQWQEEIGDNRALQLSRVAFVAALGMNGATKWRTATARGYELPLLPEGAQPMRSKTTIANHTAYRNAVLERNKSLPEHLQSPDPYPYLAGPDQKLIVSPPITGQPAQPRVELPEPAAEPEDHGVFGHTPERAVEPDKEDLVYTWQVEGFASREAWMEATKGDLPF